MVLFGDTESSITEDSVIECPVCGRRLFNLFEGVPDSELYWGQEIGNCRHVISESDDETIMDHDLNNLPAFEDYVWIEWLENGEMKHHGFLINTINTVDY